jgi:hypothetical protein
LEISFRREIRRTTVSDEIAEGPAIRLHLRRETGSVTEAACPEREIQNTTGTETRTLSDPGRKMCEYSRLDLTVAGTHPAVQPVYDAAGNLVQTNLYGDLNCDGVVSFDDIDPFVAVLSGGPQTAIAISHPERPARSFGRWCRSPSCEAYAVIRSIARSAVCEQTCTARYITTFAPPYPAAGTWA